MPDETDLIEETAEPEAEAEAAESPAETHASNPEAEALARRVASPNFVPLGADDLVRILHELPTDYALAYIAPTAARPIGVATIFDLIHTDVSYELYSASDWDRVRNFLQR